MIHINGFNITQDQESYGMWRVQKENSYSLATTYWFNDKAEAMTFAESGGLEGDSKQGRLDV